MTGIVHRMERRQVGLYLAAIGFGALAGWLAPAIAPALSLTITPVLGLLLFATFLGVPLADLGRSFRDLRFLGAVLLVNFVLAPVVVYGLSRFVATDQALLLGVLLVLLTPCVDYVIVFTGLAGGARDKLLAATPLLMLLQIVLLPAYLLLIAGADAVAVIEIGPFLEAFLVLIVLPLAAAAVVQRLARRASAAAAPTPRLARAAIGVAATMQALMVPLMMATLAAVVGSQIAAVGAQAGALLAVVPIYLAFLIVMVAVGVLAARLARLDAPAARAVVFSGSTRNSLVVLPLALALPASLALAPLAVVTQTLVELVGMVILVRLVPRLVPGQHPARAAACVSFCDAGP
ncbi:bile acid:sodium symporter [Cryobacterium sp. SO2]|uniref:arsenic resistance protein n=1 Tax=Cryobacterium sp. SO2 TaxID=1897060 RepID=UPI00223C9076|nr:bile acid:sodium symporter [Cryobacterium sp. SO2]WEO77415.1 bile acid:sodium symporter [Cryobacterium sp. SO2]